MVVRTRHQFVGAFQIFCWLGLSFGLSPASASLLFPRMAPGDYYEAAEEMVLTSPSLGAGGSVTLHSNARYLVRGVEAYQQESSGAGHQCFHLAATGATSGEGELHITSPIPFDGVVRMENGQFEGDVWLRTSDFALAGRRRLISGSVAALYLGNWITVGSIRIEEHEEYVEPLRHGAFPLDFNQSLAQRVTLHYFGNVLLPIVGSTAFDENLTLETATTVSGPEPLDGCDTLRIITNDLAGDFNLTSAYCCEANWWLGQRVRHLPLGTVGAVDSRTVTVSSYHVQNASCQPYPTYTPSPAPSDTPTPRYSPTPTFSSAPVSTPTPTVPPVPELLVSWTNSMERIRPRDPLPGREGEALTIELARNEFDGGQVFVKSSVHRAVSDVQCSLSELTLETNAAVRIPPENATFFRQHYIWVDPNSKLWEMDPAAKGWWPDGLIPDVDPYYRERRAAFPFDLNAAFLQGVSLGVYAPLDVPAGTYRGTMRVTSATYPAVEMPVQIVVWDFTLPGATHLRSTFGYSKRSIDDCHARFSSTPFDDEELHRLYLKEALRNRMTVSWPALEMPSYVYDANLDAVVMDWTAYDAGLEPYMEGSVLPSGATFNTVRLPYPSWFGADRHKSALFWKAWADHFREKGWFDRLFLYTRPDEPKESDFPSNIESAGVLHEGDPDLLALVTIHYNETLADHINLWCPLINNFGDSWPTEFGPEKYRERQALGEHVWWYNCDAEVMDKDWPDYFIDRPGIFARMQPWVGAFYGVEGILYWETTYAYRGDPWSYQYYMWAQGDGTLFYPGIPEVIGGQHHIPLPSLRLQAIRDGFEDDEYFQILADLNLAGVVETVITGRVRSTVDWDQDPRHLLESRRRLAAAILQALHPSTPAPGPTPTPTATLPPLEPPVILAAGYLATDLAHGREGTLDLTCLAMGARGSAAARVEVYYGGAPLGVEVPGKEGAPGWFGLTLPGIVAEGPAAYALELVAFSEEGVGSRVWPYLEVR